MDLDQQHRLWDAVITAVVTFNAVMLVVLQRYQMRRHESEDRRHELIARHVDECVRAHRGG